MSRALPTDGELLAALHDLYAVLDPPPGDLADGVLARLDMEGADLDYELLSLVEAADLAGVRSSDVDAGDGSPITLEFAGTTYQVLVRVSTSDHVRRLDGWVVPAGPMDVRLLPSGGGTKPEAQSTRLDDLGRFEFHGVHPGEARIWLLPDLSATPGEEPLRPFATPPFLV